MVSSDKILWVRLRITLSLKRLGKWGRFNTKWVEEYRKVSRPGQVQPSFKAIWFPDCAVSEGLLLRICPLRAEMEWGNASRSRLCILLPIVKITMILMGEPSNPKFRKTRSHLCSERFSWPTLSLLEHRYQSSLRWNNYHLVFGWRCHREDWPVWSFMREVPSTRFYPKTLAFPSKESL